MIITIRGTRLPAELLRLISLHLKPRHLYKLLQTSKLINKKVDNESYWERVALHLHFRDYDELGVRNHVSTYPRIYGLYNMRFLQRGYYDSMNAFIWRVRHMISTRTAYWKNLTNASISTFESMQDQFHDTITISEFHGMAAENAKFWEDLQGAPLSTLVRKSEEKEDLLFDETKERPATMKSWVKNNLNFFLQQTTGINAIEKIANDLDDDSDVPLSVKIFCAQKIHHVTGVIGLEFLRSKRMIAYHGQSSFQI